MQTDGRDCCQKTGLLKSRETFNILIGVTGSVAALKLPLLVSQLLQIPGVSLPSSCLSFHFTLFSPKPLNGQSSLACQYQDVCIENAPFSRHCFHE